MTEAVYSVSEINNFIKHILEQEPELRNLQVVGEISNFKRYPSGHCYFTLKDAGAVLKCVMFRSKAVSLRFQPQNGDTVVAVGRLAVYERDGVYQLYTDLLLQQGVGDLMQAYEKLKQKLERAGLFAPERKQQLPLHPRTVGIITSPAGAAVRDIITVSRRRNQGIKLLLYPVKVQGEGAAAEIAAAIEAAKADTTRPTMIKVNTVIGYGCPAKQGKASAHGEPLGEENVAALKEYLEWPCKEAVEDEWNALFEKYRKEYPDMAEKWDAYYNGYDLSKLFDSEDYWKKAEKPEATRSTSGSILNEIKQFMPNLIGGSADLAPSNKTNMKDAGDFSKDNYAGTNLHFGVREQAMAAIGNGLALHGGLKAFVATFFVFSDYTKPMARLSALMNLPLTFIFTHDSIGVGEDGPTHEPVEQLAAFRSLPNFCVYRPCDRTETAAAWYRAVTSKDQPTALVLTRQNLSQMQGSSKEALKGGYILEDSKKEVPDAIIIASGSEVELAVNAKAELAKDGVDVRVVSMPSMEAFEEQTAEYKESVLPKACRKRVAVEALSDFGWYRYVGLDGKVVSMTGFGASGPAASLFEKFGFTTENVVAAVKSVL